MTSSPVFPPKNPKSSLDHLRVRLAKGNKPLKPKKPRAKQVYSLLWRNKWLTSDAKTVEEMSAKLRAAATELMLMAVDGVVLSYDVDGMGDDYAILVTTDPVVAKKYRMGKDRPFED